MQGIDPAKSGIIAATGRALKERMGRFFPTQKFVIELMPAAITRAVWLKMAQRSPFIGIAFQDVEVPGSAGVNPIVEQHWQVHLVVQANTAEVKLLGDAGSPGLVNMLGVAMLGLHAWSIPDIGMVSCGKAVSLGGEFLSDQQGVVGIPLSIPTQLVADEEVAELATLEELEIVWNFNPTPHAPEELPPLGGTDTIDLNPED